MRKTRMKKRLARKFYTRNTLRIARELLGKYIIRVWRGKKIIGRIVETEAYVGRHDKASHSYGGRRTDRTDVMYWMGGHAYLYFTYGMHWMFNVVTGNKESPEAVLIRAVEPVRHSDMNIARGPAKVARYFHLDRAMNKDDLVASGRLWIEDWREKPEKIATSVRIGVDYAGVWAKKKWRFYIAGNPCVSGKMKKLTRAS